LHSTRHKIGHFGDVLSSQSLGVVLNRDDDGDDDDKKYCALVLLVGLQLRLLACEKWEYGVKHYLYLVCAGWQADSLSHR